MGQLDGLRILVVDADYFFAEDLAVCLAEEGAEVIGPVGSPAEAMDVATRSEELNHAVFDVNLRREKTYRLAHMLTRWSVPFVFLTGYDRRSIDPEFCDTPVVNKPVNIRQLVSVLTGTTTASH